MSTEAPVVANIQQAFPDSSDAAVSARFAQYKAAAEEKAPEAKVDPLPIEKHLEAKPEAKVEEKKETKDDPLADFLGDEKKTVDEYEAALNEEIKGPTKNENFKRFKDISKQKVDSLLKQIEELKSKVPGEDYVPEKLAKKMEETQRLLTQREELIARINVEKSPQFHEKFTHREDQLSKRLEKAIKEFGLEEDMGSRLLGASLKRRAEMLGDTELNHVAISSLTNILDQHDQLSSEKQEFLENWKTNAQKMEEEAQAQQDAENAKVKNLYDRAFEESLADMAKTNFAFKKRDGNEKWNQGLEEDIKFAKELMEGNFTPHQYSEIALAGARAKRLYPVMEQMATELRSARAELAELKAAGPATPRGPDGKNGPDLSKMTPDERAAYTFNQLRSAAVNGQV